MPLYEHQIAAIKFLSSKPSAALFHEMGTGKSRSALYAAWELFRKNKIDRVLVLCPAATSYSWREEISKLIIDGINIVPIFYNAKEQKFYAVPCGKDLSSRFMPVCVVSYGLIQQERHVKALTRWAFEGECCLICDESSFCKNRTAKQTKGAAKIADSCCYRWLLTGTPIANSPLDLYGQALVMSNGDGPLKGFANFYHFRSRYAVTQPMRFGNGRTFQQVVSYQNLDELQRKFAPYVSRVEKKDCLDLPEKTYVTREVALSEETWKIYQELKREAMLALPDSEERPEPNAAVRILRLCQLTSGHVGRTIAAPDLEFPAEECNAITDVSSEKLDWLVESILDGEIANERALVIFCRWRRERERLQQMLAEKIEICRVFGGQQDKNRSFEIQAFQTSTKRRVMIAQVHAGAYGLTLHAASTAIYLSNTFSYTDRIQSSDRIHRIGQTKACLYIDILACGPKGQRTCDHHIIECLKEKHDVASLTCSAWRKALQDE